MAIHLSTPTRAGTARGKPRQPWYCRGERRHEGQHPERRPSVQWGLSEESGPKPGMGGRHSPPFRAGCEEPCEGRHLDAIGRMFDGSQLTLCPVSIAAASGASAHKRRGPLYGQQYRAGLPLFRLFQPTTRGDIAIGSAVASRGPPDPARSPGTCGNRFVVAWPLGRDLVRRLFADLAMRHARPS